MKNSTEKTEPPKLKQTTDSLLMIRPLNCGYNPQTADSNAFQKTLEDLPETEIKRCAAEEFDRLVETLRAHDINIFVIEDTPEPVKPDAVFPNNWISLHEDGTIFLYPLLSEKRRAEIRTDIIETLGESFHIERVIDLSQNESRILEGTGSMIFDHANRIVYACLSTRTDKNLLEKFAARIDYEPISFVAADTSGAEIYHTNVMMSVGERLTIICLEAINNLAERKMIVEKLTRTNHEIVEISFEQMNRFAGNMLEVSNRRGEKYLLMSAAAHVSLNADQIERIERRAQILSSNIEIIEAVGGGSVRCMLAEIFCARK